MQKNIPPKKFRKKKVCQKNSPKKNPPKKHFEKKSCQKNVAIKKIFADKKGSG